MDLNWETIGAIGEIVGAVAVVASLAYLANQIRTQNSESRSAAMHNISVGFRDSISTFADPQLAIILSKAISEDSELSEPELIQLYVGVTKIFRVWEEAYALYRRGRLEDDIWDSMMRQYSVIMGTPAFLRVWEERRHVFGVDFQKFADSVEPKEKLAYK